MRQALELIRLRFGRSWWLMLLLSWVATAFAAVWWEFDVMEISDDERGAYDDGLKAFTLPKRDALKFLQSEFGLGKLVHSEDVVIVALDDTTMTEVAGSPLLRQRYGSNLPFDRVVWADLYNYLSRAGAKAVAFDMVMNEQSSDGTGDRAFAEALDESSVPLILSFNTSATAPPLPKIERPNFERPLGKMPEPPTKEVPEGEFPEDPTPEEQAAAAKFLAEKRLEWAALAYSVPIEFAGGLEAPQFPTVLDKESGKELQEHPMASLPAMLESVDFFGSASSEEDEDGKLRRTSFAFTDGDNTYATLPVLTLAALEKNKHVAIAPGVLTIGERKVRINNDGSAEINYGGRLADRFTMIPLGGVVSRYLFCQGKEQKVCPDGDISKDPEAAIFKDKIVLVGGIAVGTGDSKATPLEQAVPGLVKQAATLDNLLHDNFIIAAPFWLSLLFSFFVAFFSVMLVLVVRNTFVDIGWPVLLYVGFFLLTGSFLVATGQHVLSAMPGLAGTVGSILATSYERLFARRDRDRLKELFQNYMEADLVELMVEQKTLPKLDGENMRVTAFFSDIKGFSTFSEKYKNNPKRLMWVINRYLSTVTPELTREGACIDKYIGDAVVALFGAPVRHHDHAIRACRGALAVQKAIGELREKFRAEGLPDVYTRIGLNTGEMMVGNIGSEQLLDFTAIGDEMNLAARLEGANKQYGTLIMMGEGTWAEVKAEVEARELDRVRVAGKTQAVTVYELLAMKGGLSTEKRKVVDLYAQALLAYRARRFEEAKSRAGEALRIDREDGPSQRLVGLCDEFLKEPPPADWDGVSSLEK